MSAGFRCLSGGGGGNGGGGGPGPRIRVDISLLFRWVDSGSKIDGSFFRDIEKMEKEKRKIENGEREVLHTQQSDSPPPLMYALLSPPSLKLPYSGSGAGSLGTAWPRVATNACPWRTYENAVHAKYLGFPNLKWWDVCTELLVLHLDVRCVIYWDSVEGWC